MLVRHHRLVELLPDDGTSLTFQLHELLPDGFPHAGHEPVEPDLDLALADAGHLEQHLFPVLGDHRVRRVRRLPLPVLFHDQLGHRVEQLGQVLRHHLRLVPLGQDVQQVGGRGEVEPGKKL